MAGIQKNERPRRTDSGMQKKESVIHVVGTLNVSENLKIVIYQAFTPNVLFILEHC